MPRLGIVIVHYHAEDLLARCLEALESSEFDDFEVIVVDNGSTAGLQWVDRDGGRYCVIAAGSNVGFAVACNLALAQLRGHPFVLLLNPDVIVEAGTIGEIVTVLEGDERIGAATCKVVLAGGGLDPACRRADPTLPSAAAKYLGLQTLLPRSRTFGRYNLTYLDADRPTDIDSGTGAFLLMPRAALDAIGGGLDERFFLYGEDLDLCRRIRLAGYKVRYWPRVTATHIKGSGRTRSLRATFEFHRAMWIYYRKWGTWGRNVLVLAPLLAILTTLGAASMLANTVSAGLSARGRR